MEPDSVQFRTLKSNPIFRGLTEGEYGRLARELPPVEQFSLGDVLVSEGDGADAFFIVVSGLVEVRKHEATSASELRLYQMGVGEAFGELVLMDEGRRSASIIALEKTEVLKIPLALLEKLSPQEKSLEVKIRMNTAALVSQRMRRSNEVTVKSLTETLDEAKKRVALGQFSNKVLLAICGYIFAMGVVTALGLKGSSYVTIPMTILFLGLIGNMILTSGYSLDHYGITLNNWKKHALQGVLVTLPALVVVVLLKWAWVTWAAGGESDVVFDLGRSKNLSSSQLFFMAAIYGLIVAPLEEVIRGGVQGSFQLLSSGKNKIMHAIVLSNIAFSAVHVHMSLGVAILVFPVGLFWGWLFAKQGSVIGPIVCHMMLGLFTFFVVGVPQVLMG